MILLCLFVCLLVFARNKNIMSTLLDLCVSSLRRGHANLLCIVPIVTDDPRRESVVLICVSSVRVRLQLSYRSLRKAHSF